MYVLCTDVYFLPEFNCAGFDGFFQQSLELVRFGLDCMELGWVQIKNFQCLGKLHMSAGTEFVSFL